MPDPETRSLIEQLPATLRDDLAALPDGRLLERFLLQRDEPAFELLLRRHRAMVFGVCRRVLARQADAEDAFQAVFLVLLRRGPGLVQRDNLGGWLYGVAFNTARKARLVARRRFLRELTSTRPTSEAAPDPSESAEALRLLDEELSRLPEALREAVVTCELEGMPLREAATRLGVPVGTLSGRLTTARRRLAERLGRRGLDAPALLALATAPLSVPPVNVAVGGVAAEIAREVLATMLWTARLKLALLGVLLLLGLGGVAVGVQYALAARPAEVVAVEDPPAPVVPDEKPEFANAQLDVRTAAVQPAGVPILLDIKLTNLGKEPLHYWCGGPGRYPGFNNTIVHIVDGQGKASMAVLSNGQYIQGSGISVPVPSCTAIDVPAVIPPLAPGKYTLRIGRGEVARIEVKEDAALAGQWEQALLKRIRAGEPFAQHVAREAQRPGVLKAILRDLEDGTQEQGTQASMTLFGTRELPAGTSAALVRAIPRRIEMIERENVRTTDLVIYLAMIAGRLKTDELVPVLIEASKADLGEESRSRLVDALGEFPQLKAREEMRKLLNSESGRVQFAAAWALAKQKDTSALPFLLKVANDVKHQRREDAYYLLRFFKSDLQVEAVLRRALTDADPRIAATARRSLE
jgi:RNA polymerase sigma factor (sigma-70 family)